jgi:protocatechuate 3,4-dioxygenase beta subunit
MPVRERSRREVLMECLAGGLLLVPTRWSEADVLATWLEPQTARQPTAHVEMGPFYKKRAPSTTMLRAQGDPGLPLSISGRVLTVHGEVVPNAKIEVWQANHGGLYDLDGYRYRAAISPRSSGAYRFESVMPGHYPARVARHVHYFVTAPGFKSLSTQLYFATDEAFEGDPDKNFSKDPLVTSRTLVRPVTLSGTPEAAVAAVEFELVMEKAR